VEEGLKRNETPKTFTGLVQDKKDQELPPGSLFFKKWGGTGEVSFQ